jgi:glycerol kinase
MKVTFGTGAFALSVTGNQPSTGAGGGLLSTVSWQLAGDQAVYALDGGVYNAGSAVNWARAQGLFTDFAEIARLQPAPAACGRVGCAARRRRPIAELSYRSAKSMVSVVNVAD